jgi:stearoyl-CoA desaturase (delta-9 desaturase)
MDKTRTVIAFNVFYISLGIASLFLIDNFLLILPVWLFVAFGNGTAGHRYIGHSQFETSAFMHWMLVIWCTVSAYSSPLYWQVQHKHHHRNTDKHSDIHSPVNGYWQAMFFWAFNQERLDSVFIERASKVSVAKALKDPAIKFASTYFIAINVLFLALMLSVSTSLLFAMGIAFCLEHIRLGLINTICHAKKFPGNYRNHKTGDLSQNNLILGIISLGFGWHNNHHADPKKLILTEKWWEIDLEGQLGKMLSRKTYER